MAGERKRAAKKEVNYDENGDEPAVKKGRGRGAAAKQQAEEENHTTTRTRGRGKKTDVKVKSEPEGDDSTMDAEEEEQSAPATTKKGRGKKVTAAVKTEVKDEVEEAASVTTKKGRGKRATAAVKTEVKDEEEEAAPVTTKKGRKGKGTAKMEVDDQLPSTSSDTADPPTKEQSKKAPGVDRVVVVKGRAAVDALCPIAKNSHVYEEDEDIWDCMLNQTNIQFNNNKYYLIQLLEDDSTKAYSVWMRWGRVGATGQSSLQPCGSDLNKAMKIFTKKFSDKTKNDWDERWDFEKVPGKYDLLKMDYSKGEDATDAAATKKEKEVQKKVECMLTPRVRAVIELICDVRTMEETVVEMKYDARKAPLGKLTADQIKAGYLALKRIDDIIQSNKFSNQELLHACNDFYTRVPHYFGMKVPPLIRTKTEIKEKVALLEALGDIQAALSVLDQPIDVNTHPADQQYQSLKCDLSPLDKESSDYTIIQKYLQTTHAKTHSQYSLELLEVLSCRKEMEYERFKDVGNRMLLWHGSRMSNWAGILSQGLRIAPPEAPSTGYMFGKGVYFADMSSKSANYCWANTRNNTGFLLLCEVALGKMNEIYHADYNADKLPKGCHSVKGCGRTAPKPENITKLSDGTMVPMGPGAQVTTKNSTGYSLLYNEFIVYDTAQIRTKFLLKVKFNYK